MASPVSQQIKNLKGGISQQPENLRYPNQGDVQVNCWSSEAEGLQKRSPSVFVKKLADSSAKYGDAVYHMVNRDETERYIMVMTNRNIEVYDLNGNKKVVNGSDSDYMVTGEPQKDLRAISVADYTFVVNRNIRVQAETEKTYPSWNKKKQGIVSVKGGQYGRKLAIKVNGSEVGSYQIPDGSEPTHVKDTDIAKIADELKKAINEGTGTHGITASAGTGYVALKSTGNIDSVQTDDGYAGALLNGFTYQTNNMNKLPLTAPPDYLVEITGEVTGTGDSYWVRYDVAQGLWRETVSPQVSIGLNKNTMPHALIREANGEFTFRAIDWGERGTGDDDTNPLPSFVDSRINDVFYFRNRLGFLAGENVVMSRSGGYFDFFPASVAVLNDDDPVDIAVSHNQIAVLKFAVPFNEQLLLWSEQAQFVLSSTGLLTNRTVNLEMTSQFYVSDAARPYGIDRGVYFVAPRATFSSIKRYYMLQDVSDAKSAEDISGHVPNYVPNTIYHMHGSGSENFLLCLTSAEGSTNKLFIYKYLYVDEVLVQQSWSHWDFGTGSKILTAYCIGSYMWLILKRNNAIVMERVEFTKNTVDFSTEPYRAHMDMKVTLPAGEYDLDTNMTRWVFSDIYGFKPPEGEYTYLRQDGSFINVYYNGTDSSFSLSGEITESATFGKIYPMNYKFSKFLPKAQAEDGTVMTEDIGRLQLSRAWVNYNETGSFEIQVDNGSREFSYPMGGGRYGHNTVTIGEPIKSTDTMRFPVTGNAKMQSVWIVSDNPTPVSIVGCGWEGRLIKRSQSI